MICGIHQKLVGKYKIGVVNKQDEIKWQDWQNNLILNQGMDALNASSIVDQFTSARAGTGTRATNIASAGSTADQSGTTVHLLGGGTFVDFTAAAGGYSSGAQVGDMIKFSNTSEVRITTVTDATHVEVTPAQSVSGLTFVIWKTSQTGLQTEVSHSTAFLVGNCGTVYDASGLTTGLVQHTRTYNFNIEGNTQNYSEIGVANTSTGSVFSRILLPTPIAIPSGSKLRIIYELDINYSPVGQSPLTASIGGWPVSPATNTWASQSIQDPVFSKVNSDGSSNNFFVSLDPYSSGARCSFWASPISTSLSQTFAASVSRIPAANNDHQSSTKAAYTSLSFTCDKTATFDDTQNNITNIRSMGFGDEALNGHGPWTTGFQAFCVLFKQDQTKTSIQSMTLIYRWSWGRVLS